MSYYQPLGRGRGRVVHPQARPVNVDLDTLYQVFKQFDKGVIDSVYASYRNNMEETWKALDNMSKPATTGVSISKEMKLKFFCAVFDKLDKKAVQLTLEKKKWEVEQTLDDLFAAEEKRVKIEDERRKREEEYRRQQQQEAERLRNLQRTELERRNLVISLHCLYPKLSPEYIWGTLQQYGWDQNASLPALKYAQEQIVQQEAYFVQLKEQQLREEEGRRKEEEMKKLQAQYDHKMSNLAKDENFDKIVQNCTNWDDVMQQITGEKSKVDPVEVKEQKTAQKEVENQHMVSVAQAMFPQLTEQEIKQIFQKHNWDGFPALEEMEKVSFNKVKERLIQMFPALPPSQVEEVLNIYYPNDLAAVQDLHPLNQIVQQRQIQEAAAKKTKQEFDAAVKRYHEFEQEIKEMEKQRLISQNEINNMPEGKEKAFMQSMQEMKTQKEQFQIQEQKQRLLTELEERRKQFKSEEEKLGLMETIEVVEGKNASKRSDWSKNNQRPSTREKLNSFEELMQVRRTQMAAEKEENEKHKQSFVAQKMLVSLGEQKFAILQEAIGRAPGGVAKGFKRKDYSTSSKPEVQPLQLPAQPNIIRTGTISPRKDGAVPVLPIPTAQMAQLKLSPRNNTSAQPVQQHPSPVPAVSFTNTPALHPAPTHHLAPAQQQTPPTPNLNNPFFPVASHPATSTTTSTSSQQPAAQLHQPTFQNPFYPSLDSKPPTQTQQTQQPQQPINYPVQPTAYGYPGYNYPYPQGFYQYPAGFPQVSPAGVPPQNPQVTPFGVYQPQQINQQYPGFAAPPAHGAQQPKPNQ